MHRWEDLDAFLMGEAAHDLEAGAEMARPCLAAYRGEAPCFIAFLRDFEKGEYADPMIELLALAAPLDCDRLALAISGRAWSFDDPIPPVTDDVDLRQRVLVIERADASRGRSRSTSLVVPYDDPVPGQPVRWHEPRDLGASEGWISGALALAVSTKYRREMRAPLGDIAAQAARVDLLGHDVWFAREVHDRLADATVTPEQARRARLPEGMVREAAGVYHA